MTDSNPNVASNGHGVAVATGYFSPRLIKMRQFAAIGHPPRAKPSSEALSVFVLTERLWRSGVTNSESFSVAADESDALRKG